jgi:hypothetical protein
MKSFAISLPSFVWVEPDAGLVKSFSKIVLVVCVWVHSEEDVEWLHPKRRWSGDGADIFVNSEKKISYDHSIVDELVPAREQGSWVIPAENPQYESRDLSQSIKVI